MNGTGGEVASESGELISGSELTTVNGSSAGPLIRGMIVAGLTDREVHDKVMVTGTINPNGTVGNVGSIEEKTKSSSGLWGKYTAHARGAGIRV